MMMRRTYGQRELMRQAHVTVSQKTLVQTDQPQVSAADSVTAEPQNRPDPEYLQEEPGW